MKQTTTADLRLRTIEHWAAFSHARSEQDVARVHAFQAIVRDNPDLAVVTDDQVSAAYGGRGWAPTPACWECGARDDNNVEFGNATDKGSRFALCVACIARASAMTAPAAPAAPLAKPGILTRLFKGA